MEQTMLTKPFLAVALLASLAVVSGAANASATKRHWSSEASAGAYRDVGTLSEVHESYAPVGDAVEPVRGGSEDVWRYHGGPKSAF
jgi:hypothetical protein